MTRAAIICLRCAALPFVAVALVADWFAGKLYGLAATIELERLP